MQVQRTARRPAMAKIIGKMTTQSCCQKSLVDQLESKIHKDMNKIVCDFYFVLCKGPLDRLE